MAKAIETAISEKESAVLSAIKTVYFMCLTNTALEQHSSYIEFLTDRNCPEIKALSIAKNATHASLATASEVVTAISDCISDSVIDRMKESSCVALLCDESSDISVTGKLIVYAKMVDAHLNPHTDFVCNLTLTGKDAESITQALFEVLGDRGWMQRKYFS